MIIPFMKMKTPAVDPSPRKIYGLILLWYFLFYFYECITSTYWVKYLQFHGLSPSHIGSIASVGLVLSLIMQPFWATRTDKAKYKNNLQSFVLLGTMAALSLLFLPIPAKAVAPFLLMVYILYQVFQAPGAFLSDTIALENLERTGRPFGRVRLMGSIGWAVSGLLIGALLGRNVELFVPMAVVTGFALFAVQRSLPKVQGHMQKSARSFRSIGTFFKNRAVYPVLIAEAGFSFGMSLTSIFLLARFESLGGTTGMYGLFLFLATMTEIPYLFYGDRIVKRFGTTKVLVAVAITSALRLFYLAWMPSWEYIFAVVMVQGILVLRIYCITTYINRASPPELKASGQMLYATTTGSFRAVGSFCGGLLVERVFGGEYADVFWVAGGICVLTAVWIWISMRRQGEVSEPLQVEVILAEKEPKASSSS